MHYRSALSLALLCTTAVAQPPATNSSLTSPNPNLASPLTIVVRSDASTPARVLIAMEREVESLTAPSGIHVNWALSTDPPRVFEQLAVVTLRGACRPGAPIPAAVWLHRGQREALGQTQIVDGQILPFADIRCDPVRQLIARELSSRPPAEREEVLGRALGRVTAHELYHIVLRTTTHGRNGLAREAQSSQDLTADNDYFAPADEHRLSQAAAGDDGDSSGSGR